MTPLQAVATGLKKGLRDFLIAHVDGGAFVPVEYCRADRYKRDALLAKKLLVRDRRSGHTVLSDDGRVVLAIVLADYAEKLIASGFGSCAGLAPKSDSSRMNGLEERQTADVPGDGPHATGLNV